VTYFSQSKGERDRKGLNPADGQARYDEAAPGKSSPDVVSALGRGMLVTGNIVCAGSMQISGRVIGDIHAANLVICEGAHVEGNITAQEAVIQGVFKGTIHANSVKLQSTAVVDGEILKQSLTIEPNAQFEGLSRRLEKPIEAPSSDQVRGGRSASGSAEVVPISGAAG
jgi:cytoskeletal protein CcmA (bactofilin family)